MIVRFTTLHVISAYPPPITLWVRSGHTTLCDKVCQWLVEGRHDISEILLKVELNTIALTLTQYDIWTEAKRNIKYYMYFQYVFFEKSLYEVCFIRIEEIVDEKRSTIVGTHWNVDCLSIKHSKYVANQELEYFDDVSFYVMYHFNYRILMICGSLMLGLSNSG